MNKGSQKNIKSAMSSTHVTTRLCSQLLQPNLPWKGKHFPLITLAGSTANRDFIFESHMEPSLNPVSFQTYVWDSLELRLFQTQSLVKDIGADQIEQTLFVLRNTVPATAAGKIDYFYGDHRELLSIAQANLVQLRSFCRSKENADSAACQDSKKPFPLGFPNYFHPIDMSVQFLSMYGLAGDITVSTIDRQQDSETTGQVIQTSLISNSRAHQGQPAVQYCSVLPKTLYDIPYPVFIDFYKAYMASVSVDCQAKQIRSSRNQQGRKLLEAENRTSSSSTSFPVSTPAVPASSISDVLSDVTTISGKIDQTNSNLSNPLGLRIADLGLDPLGFWRCYGGLNDYTRNPECYRQNAQSMYNFFSNQPAYGFQGPVFAAVDMLNPGSEMEVRISLTGALPSCEGRYSTPEGVKVSIVKGYIRALVYSSLASILSVWTCGPPNRRPSNFSIINITRELELAGLPPLEPGPIMLLDLTFSEPLSAVHLALLQEHICTTVWDKVDDLCKWRIWSSMTSTTIGNQTVWAVSVISVYKSNSNAARANYLVTKLVNSVTFQKQFDNLILPEYFPAIISPSSVIKRDSVYGCASHYDCAEGLFCSLNALGAWSSDYLGGGAACDLCRYCISDNMDPIDKWCPRDKCGASIAGYPSCINGSKLFDNISCSSSYIIDMTLNPDYNDRRANSQSISNVRSPESSLIKARFLTKFNQLVGALTVTQRRSNGTCNYKDDKIGRYNMMKDPTRGQICRGNNPDPRPYGYDPAFLSSSPIYDGTLEGIKYYKLFRINPLTLQAVPYGFFPHSYDGQNRSNKRQNITIADEADSFKLFFEERLSSAQAQRMITYMQTGEFLDSQTDSVVVEAVTVNASDCQNLQSTGQIAWDYTIRSVPGYLYPDENIAGRVILEVLCVGCLLTNTILEVKDVYDAARRFKMLPYLSSSWNFMDWAHFSVMWLAWVVWLKQYLLTCSLPMESSYPILARPQSTTRARIFLTDAVNEYKYLLFSRGIKQMMENMALYSTLTSLSVLLFVLRLLKTLDFQPKMALITRTLRNTMSDLTHFFVLFTIVWMGYTLSGMILFGHLFSDFSTLSRGATGLIIILINWDPSSTIVQAFHASSEWMYSLFLWSWILLAYYILLNIFLAILVDGYIAVKKESQARGASGIDNELYHILKHEMQRVIRFLYPKYPFVSDEQICKRISRRLRQTRSSSVVRVHRVLCDFHKISLSSIYQVNLGSGERASLDTMYSMLKDLDLLQVQKSEDSHEQVKSPQQAGNSEKYVHSALSDVMMRYGAPILPSEQDIRKEQNEAFLEITRLDAMKRIAQLHLDSLSKSLDKGKNNQEGTGEKKYRFKLHVAVQQARNLPKMDVGRGVDIFCALFVEGCPGLFQTEILRGISEADWIWTNAEFEWDLGQMNPAEDHTRNLVIMVYDKDQVSSDDLIGCVSIRLGELQEASFEGWREIIRPQPVFFSRNISDSARPELKVKAQLSS